MKEIFGGPYYFSSVDPSAPSPRLEIVIGSLNKSFSSTVSFYQPDLFLTSAINFIKKSDSKVTLLQNDKKIEATLYTHNFYIPSIKWAGVNYYYVDDTGFILSSEQDLHPNLPRFKIDYFYKF